MWLLHAIVGWIASALALWVVAQIIPGIRVRDFRAALIATIIIGVVNAVVGPVARFIALPLTIVTLGLFLLVVNAFLLKLASLFTPGFQVQGFLAALIGSVILTLLTSVLRAIANSAIWGIVFM